MSFPTLFVIPQITTDLALPCSLTHAPPAQILDIGRGGEHAGCEALAARVALLRPQLHVFGHIHEDHGACIREWAAGSDTNGERTLFVNAANLPAGPKAWASDGGRVPFGRDSYGPVIVDLYDPVVRGDIP